VDWDGAGDAVLGGRPRLRGVSVVDDGRGLLVFGGRPLGRFVGVLFAVFSGDSIGDFFSFLIEDRGVAVLVSPLEEVREPRRVDILVLGTSSGTRQVGQNHFLEAGGTDDKGGSKQNVWYSSSHSSHIKSFDFSCFPKHTRHAQKTQTGTDGSSLQKLHHKLFSLSLSSPSLPSLASSLSLPGVFFLSFFGFSSSSSDSSSEEEEDRFLLSKSH